MPLLPDYQMPLRYPVFSADGRLAAIHTQRTYDIVSVDPDGGQPECLLCDSPKTGWGSVGRDGDAIFIRRQAERSTVVISEAGGLLRPLTDPEESASCPVVSPDLTRVAYLAQVEGATELRVRPYDGGEPVSLARDLETSEFVSWSPDGGNITYAGGSPLRVWQVSAAGGTPKVVSGPGGDYPSWSPDGSSIAYSIWTEESDPDQGTWLVDVSGDNPRKISDFPTRVVWDAQTGSLLQLRRSTTDGSLELWRFDPVRAVWSRRSRLDLGIRPPIQIEYLPLTLDPATGRLVMNRLTGKSRLVVFDGIEIERW